MLSSLHRWQQGLALLQDMAGLQLVETRPAVHAQRDSAKTGTMNVDSKLP